MGPDGVARCILPFLMLLFVLAWMDRVNVGFAQLQIWLTGLSQPEIEGN